MANIPEEDINELWEQSEHSWEGLKEVLEEKKSEETTDTLVTHMIEAVNELEDEGQDFPDSPDKLIQILNDKVEYK